MRFSLLDVLRLVLVVTGTMIGFVVNLRYGVWATLKGTGLGFVLGQLTGLAILLVEMLIWKLVLKKDQARVARTRAAWRQRLATEREAKGRLDSTDPSGQDGNGGEVVGRGIGQDSSP